MNQLQAAIISYAFNDELEKISSDRSWPPVRHVPAEPEGPTLEDFTKVAHAGIVDDFPALDQMASLIWEDEYLEADDLVKLATLQHLAGEVGEEEALELLDGIMKLAAGKASIFNPKTWWRAIAGGGDEAAQTLAQTAGQAAPAAATPSSAKFIAGSGGRQAVRGGGPIRRSAVPELGRTWRPGQAPVQSAGFGGGRANPYAMTSIEQARAAMNLPTPK
jgi:hypothetical protein